MGFFLVLCVLGLILLQGAAQAVGLKVSPARSSRLEKGRISDAPAIELINHLGGQSLAVFVQGNILFAGFGPELAILELSDPANPVRLGYAILPGMITDLHVEAGFAYVALGEAGLGIVNVSNPYLPTITGRYDSPGIARSVTYAGGYVYIADDTQGLRVVSVSDPFAPVEIGFVPTSDWARGVAISGNYAFVAADTADLRVIDISNPYAPYEAGYLDTAGSAWDVTVQGTYLYLAATYKGLRVINIANPIAPYEIGYFETSEYIYYVHAHGSYVFGSDWYNGNFYIINVANPASPYLEGSAGGYAWDWPHINASAAINSTVFITGEDRGLHIVDMSNPALPVEVGRSGGSYQVTDLGIENNRLFATDRRIHIFDVTNPESISRINVFNYAWNNRVEVNNGYLFASTGNYYPPEQLIFDVSDPSNPNLISITEISGVMQDCVFVDHYAYLGVSKGIEILDITNPAAPINVGSLQTYLDVWRVAVQDDYLYLVDDGARMITIDISNPSSPQLISYYHVPGYYSTDLHVAGDNVIVSLMDSSGAGGLAVIDVSTPDTPQLVSTLITSSANRLAIFGQYALLAGDTSLEIVDISDLANPLLVDSYPIPFPAIDLIWDDGIIYTANGDNGIFVYRLNSFTLGGIVQAANGLPVEGVTIQAGSALTTTASHGEYALPDLMPGTYTIEPTLSGFSFFPPSRDVTLPPDSLAQNFTILPEPVFATLTPGITTTIRFTDTQGLVTQLVFPADAVSSAVDVLVTPGLGVGGGGFSFAGHAFDLVILDEGIPYPTFTFNVPVMTTIEYSDFDIHALQDESQLTLWWLIDEQWQDATLSCDPPSLKTVDLDNNIFEIPVCQSGGFKMVGPTYQTLLPLVMK